MVEDLDDAKVIFCVEVAVEDPFAEDFVEESIFDFRGGRVFGC